MNVIFVDVGNSRTKVGYLNNGKYEFVNATLNAKVDEDWIRQLLSMSLNPACIYIASVAPKKLNLALQNLFKKYFLLTPVMLQTQAEIFGVTNGYDDFTKLGVDRWMSIIAVSDSYESSIVISAGTAITLDLVIDKKHLGGFIVPGLNLMRNSLVSTTELISFDSSNFNLRGGVKKSTNDAVSSGVMYMSASFLNGVISDIKSEHNASIKIVASGGDFATLKPFINHDIEEVTNLVIEGMIKVVSSY